MKAILLIKTGLQISLLVIFLVLFGWPAIQRYQAHTILVTTETSEPEPAGVVTPTVTVCARNTATGLGWRKRSGDITSNKDVLRHQCSSEGDIATCILENTFNFSEVVGFARLGAVGGQPLMDDSIWTPDFTWMRDGRCYTLGYKKNIGDDIEKDSLWLFSNDSTKHQVIFVHDPNFFAMNDNPKALSMTRFKVLKDDNVMYRISLVKHVLLNRPANPCEEDIEYNFVACVKESFSKEVGCRLPFDHLSDQARPVCETIKQYSRFENLYAKITDKATKSIETTTKCKKPCNYNEFRFEGSPTFASPNLIKEYSSSFALWYVSTQTTLEVEEEVYPWTSLVAEFGGTLGLFLGVSFMTLWEGAQVVTSIIREACKEKAIID